MKALKWIVIVVLVLIVGAVVAVLLGLDSIVRRTVQTQSANSLNVDTALAGASVGLLSGDVALSGFNVGNPPGFSGDDLLSLGRVAVDTSYGDLRGDPVRVASISIEEPKLVIEQKGTEFNVKKFVDNLPQGPAGEDKPPADGSKPLKLIIGQLRIAGAQVVLKPDVSALAKIPGASAVTDKIQSQYAITIPPIELKDIGTGEGNQNGAAIKDVTSRILTAMTTAAANSNELPAEVRAALTGDLSAMKDKIGTAAQEQATKLADDLSKRVGGDAGKVIGDAMKDPASVTKDPQKTAQDVLGGLLKKDDKKPSTQPAR
ncbi:MAG TPA: hypothetical protein VK324_17490 [Tepidisphaeraceae bacterium]|nr:hypothetical protein [Tepidisphaeraceae bacterium]